MLLFDLSAVQPNNSSFHGGSEYAKAVLRAVASKWADEIDFVFDPVRPLDDEMRSIAGKLGSLHPVQNAHDLQSLVDTREYRKFYSALTRSFYSRVDFGPTQFIFTRHGLRSLELRNDPLRMRMGRHLGFSPKEAAKWILAPVLAGKFRRMHAAFFRLPNTRIVAVTTHTKFSIKAHFPSVDLGSIQVFYSPAKPSATIPRTETDEPPFVLYTGTNRWEKNPIRALRVIDSFLSVAREYRAIVLGEYLPRVRLRNKSRIHHRPYVTSAELDELYSRAEVLFYPTLNEGFGYPPFEAMRHGTVSLVGASSSLFEVYRDSVFYADPTSDSELLTRLLTAVIDDEARESMRNSMARRVQELTSRMDRDLDALINLLREE